MSTAPIPALAPVMRTVLPSNLDALKMDIDEQEVIEFNDWDAMLLADFGSTHWQEF